MTKKGIVLAVAAVSMTATVAIGGTLAYFNANAGIKNTFTMGGTGGDNTFGIQLDEGKVAYDSDTHTWSIDGTEDRVTNVSSSSEGGAQTYPGNIYPSAVLPKDPTVTNTGAYDEYVRFTVTVPKASAWETATGKTDADELATAIFGATKDGFTRTNSTIDTDGNLVVNYLYENKVAANGGKTASVIDSITIPANADQAQLAALDEDGDNTNGISVAVDVSAEAVQADINGVTIGNGAATSNLAAAAFAALDA